MAKVLRWGLIGLAALIVVAALLVGLAYRQVSSKEGSATKRWIDGQVRRIVQTYLNPRLDFQDLVYVYPRTVHVTDLRLTSPDPDKPGQTVDIIKVARLTMELAEIPKEGQPIRIQKLILDHPSVQLVVPARAEAGTLIGFSDFVKASATTMPQAAQPQEVRLSEVLQITLLRFIEGEVAYQTRTGEVRTLRLDGINSKMDIQKERAGSYGLSINLDRQGIFTLDATGRLNLDEGKLDVAALALEVKLGREQDRYFPPQLQSLMADHQITGALSLKLSGMLSFADPLASKFSIQALARDAHFVAGAYRGQADRIDLAMDLAQAKLNFAKLQARTLGGQADLTGTIELGGAHLGNLALNLRDIRLEDTLRAIETGSEPKYKGLLSAHVRLDCALAKVLTEARGGGTARLRQAQLIGVPALAQVLEKVTAVFGKAPPSRNQAQDEGDFSFAFAGDRAHFTRIDLRTAAYAIRGDGDLYFNQNLDMLLMVSPTMTNSGALGQVAGLVGEVSNKLVRTHVGGTLDQPAVTVQLQNPANNVLRLPH